MKICCFKIFIIFSFLFFNTNSYSQSVNKLRKIGDEFEKSKAYEKASSYYLKALKKKSNDKNSIKGLGRCAPLFIKQITKEVNDDYNNKKYREVIDNYELVLKFKANISKYGVDIKVPSSISNLKSESDSYFAEKLYLKGKRSFDSGLYEASINEFGQCLTFKPQYKDAKNLLYKAKDALNNIEAEKYYFNGVSKLTKNNFRGAYRDFAKCLSYKSSYKDAYQLKANALKNGLAKVGVFNVTNSSNYHNGIEKTLYSKIISNIKQKQSPFIQIVDFNRIKQMNGNSRIIYNESSAARIGRGLGLEFVIVAKLISVETSGGAPKSSEVIAYEKYYVKDSKGKKVPKGRKVKFRLYEGSSKVSYRVKYQLISTKNNQIILSDIISESASDNVKYASYRGDYKKLCVTDPGSNGGGLLGSLLTNVTMVKQSLFTARKKLKTPYDLHKPTFANMAREIANEVYNEIH